MKQINQQYQSLSNSVKKLSRQQFIILLMLAVSALSYSWIKYIKPSEKKWDESFIQLPDSEKLQLYIDKITHQESEITRQVNSNIDNIIDDQAMQIKLSGLTKNITITREPSSKELSDFYQQHKEQYRQISTFQFTQYLFHNIQYGGQAVSQAQKVLSTLPSNSDKVLEIISLNTLQIDRQYGEGFSQKLLAIVLQNSTNLPCWTKPITSKVGAHLICFRQVSIGAIPELASIKPQLINHWRYETAKKESMGQQNNN